MTTVPIIGRIIFEAFLKNSRLDCRLSFWFSLSILMITFLPIDLQASAKDNKKRNGTNIKKRGDRTCCPFHAERPSHCPIQLNEQRETHADVFI